MAKYLTYFWHKFFATGQIFNVVKGNNIELIMQPSDHTGYEVLRVDRNLDSIGPRSSGKSETGAADTEELIRTEDPAVNGCWASWARSVGGKKTLKSVFITAQLPTPTKKVAQ